MTKPREFWLAREVTPREPMGYYRVCSRKLRKCELRSSTGHIESVYFMPTFADPKLDATIPVSVFEAMTGIRLNPGEGPVRVRLAMEIVK